MLRLTGVLGLGAMFFFVGERSSCESTCDFRRGWVLMARAISQVDFMG